MKTKTYMLILSKSFPKGHPREGEETDFYEKFIYGVNCGLDAPAPAKIHTIRANYALWKRRIDEVRAGKAVLSVRQWMGKPYRSKQEEIYRFDKDSGIGVERLEIIQMGPLFGFSITDAEGRHDTADPDTLAENDGLTLEDWQAWFSNRRYDRSKPMVIIHFTKFRYLE